MYEYTESSQESDNMWGIFVFRLKMRKLLWTLVGIVDNVGYKFKSSTVKNLFRKFVGTSMVSGSLVFIRVLYFKHYLLVLSTDNMS